MLAPPPGLWPSDLADVVATAWSLEPDELAYAPVGFGSHHWLADDHFVTVDDVADAAGLQAALGTARALRNDAGLEFVVAPIPTDGGELIVPLGADWVVHLYDRLDIVDDTAFGPHDDPEVLSLVRAIHEATPIVGHRARREDFSIWGREDLEAALADLDVAWDSGPFGDPARLLLSQHAEDLAAVLTIHDHLVDDVSAEGWVVTHGEPHRGNVFRTTRGWAVVDWDTVLVAPAERDVWGLGGADGDPRLAELYRLRWDLTEVAVYASGFHDDHSGDANDSQSWNGLIEHVDVRRRWPHLLL